MQNLRNDNDHFVGPYAYLYTKDTDATYETETTKRFIHQFKAASSVYALYASLNACVVLRQALFMHLHCAPLKHIRQN